MFNSGAALSGFGMPLVSSADSVSIQEGKTTASGGVAVIENGVQTVTTEIYPRGYEPIIVQKGVPVKWTIHTEEGDINGCNNSIVIPAYNIQQNLSLGDTVIAFTPEESGTFNFSCWMGMIRSTITVVDDISIVESIIIEQEPDEFDGLYIDGNAASGNAGLPACCS